VHGRGAGRVRPPVPALRHLQHREPGAQRAVRVHRLPDRAPARHDPRHHRSRPSQGEDVSETSTETEAQTSNGVQRVTLTTLTGMVVGGMVGAGVFALPRRFGSETAIPGAFIAWAIAGPGMLMLAFVFQTLAVRK